MSDSEEDFLNDLDNDFDGLSASEDVVQNERQDDDSSKNDHTETLADTSSNETWPLLESLFKQKDLIAYFKELNSLCQLNEQAAHAVENPAMLTSVANEQEHINELLKSENKLSFTDLLSTLNDILVFIRRDLESLHTYLILKYSGKFRELESLIPNAVEYANCIKVLETEEDLSDSNLAISLATNVLLTKEQIMVLTMAMKTQFKPDMNTTLVEKDNLFKAISLINQLHAINIAINDYMNVNVHLIAPNLTALIGPKVASLLIGHVGGILPLSEIPSCNLASIGKNKYQSHSRQTTISGVRQEGYIYRSELVQNEDISSHKQILRMACAKVALAARVDASQLNNSNDISERNDSLGVRWREEIIAKVRKLNEAPNLTNTKALPIPEDKPKKKRAGRKFRKYKEQFKMSHLRQLQNRVEFGKQEATVLDAFGEELGLGMSKASLNSNGESSRYIGGKVNNKAKLTKKMKARVKGANDQSSDYLLNLTEDSRGMELPLPKKQKPTNSNEWYSRHL